MGALGIYHPEPRYFSGGPLIAGIVITYRPETSILRKTVQSLIDQVDHLFIVDNGSSVKAGEFVSDHERLTLIQLEDNYGIAKAQNRGIAEARKVGADYVVLSDQDTRYPPGAISQLMDVFDRWPLAAAVVPKFNDVNKAGRDGFILASSIFFSPSQVDGGEYDLLQAIASGKLIRLSALDQVGLMYEDLFIDWVDIEWCWRARARGYQIVGSADVVIDHALGDESLAIGYREVNLRSPLRHYYITRNAFALALRTPYLSLGMRCLLLMRSLRYPVAFPLLSRPRLRNLCAVVAGLSDALLGRLGKTHRTF